jgi:hypothetical protein
MCRTGGPRCKGSGGHKASATGGGRAVPAATSTSTVPSHEDADRMAAALTRTTDGLGQPLDDRGRRFFALRDSGYTGPIDQDGYPDTSSAAAGTLRRMAKDRGEKVDW